VAATELTYFPSRVQPVSHPRSSAFATPVRVPRRLKTQRALLLLLFPTDLVNMNIHVCSEAKPMPIQMPTSLGQQETGRTFWKV
jgi:hypothetical protein